MNRGKSKTQKTRAVIQLIFFIGIAAVAVGNALYGEIISFHAICPFGGVVSFWNLATLGTLVKKAHESSVVLAVTGIVLAVAFGPVICGWICPFGTMQEWIGKIGRRITGKRYNTFIPRRVDRILRFIRYGVLIWVSWITIVSAKLVFQEIDPYYALFNFWSAEVSAAALTLLALIIILSLFVERPFCKYICPYGAFQGIFNLFRVFGIRRHEKTCISCKACDRACPMNITISTGGTVRNHQCISCLRCISTEACPQPETVTISGFRDKITIPGPLVGITTVIILLAGIGISSAAGWWKTSSSKQPAAVGTGTYKGLPDPADIRGSYTWNDVSKAFSIPVAQLLTAFEAQNPDERISTVDTRYAGKAPAGKEIGTDSVRLYVSRITGIPYTAEADTALPETAQQTEPVIQSAQKPDTVPAPTPVTITGKTTFNDLIATGYDMRTIETITGPVSNLNATVKSVCEQQGMEFSEFKAKLPGLNKQN